MSRYVRPSREFLDTLRAHLCWLRSEGDEGRRLVLQGTDLTRAYLAGSNLQDSVLTDANLEGVRGLDP